MLPSRLDSQMFDQAAMDKHSCLFGLVVSNEKVLKHSRPELALDLEGFPRTNTQTL